MGRLAGQPVTVILSGGRHHFSATVDQDGGEGLVLVMTVPPTRAYTGERVVVQYTSPTGVHRLNGSIASDPKKLEILHLAREGAEVIQRREWVRVDAVVPVKVRSGDAVGQGSTLNVSAGGMLAQDPIGLDVGADVSFELMLGDTTVPGGGEVTATRKSGEHKLMGVRFDRIANADRERIVRFVTERQRQELRMRRGG